jgi:hypothetical protein
MVGVKIVKAGPKSQEGRNMTIVESEINLWGQRSCEKLKGNDRL